MKLILRMYEPETNEEILRLTWQAGLVTVEKAFSEGLQREMERLATRGLIEWVEGDEGPVQRHTRAENPHFLPMLGENLKRQFRFVPTLSFEPSLSASRPHTALADHFAAFDPGASIHHTVSP